MADKKISALTGATTPLAGTEVLPIVQSGATVKVAVSDLTAGRAISATQLTLTTGSLIVADGQGIDFSATPGTGTSELLNDYEEGTFTPTFTGLTVGNGSVFGTYRKIGKQVTLTYGFITGSTSAVGTLSGITGYPFTTGTIGASRFFSANGTAFKSGVGWYGAYAPIYSASTSGAGPTAMATDVGMASATPFVWAANDSLSLTATYFVD